MFIVNNNKMILIEVIPDLWFGNTNISPKFIKEKDVKYIINCQEDLSFYGKAREYIDSLKQQMMRKEIGALFKYLNQMTQHIYANLMKGEPVLVVGVKHAPLLIVGYMIRYGHMSLEKALNAINSKTTEKIGLSQYDILGLQYFQQEVATQLNQ